MPDTLGGALQLVLSAIASGTVAAAGLTTLTLQIGL